jgi:hypothetical protein
MIDDHEKTRSYIIISRENEGVECVYRYMDLLEAGTNIAGAEQKSRKTVFPIVRVIDECAKKCFEPPKRGAETVEKPYTG